MRLFAGISNLFKPNVEKRSTSVSTFTNSMFSSLFLPAPKSKVTVNATTSLGISAVLRAINVISEGLASLSLQVFEEKDNLIEPATKHDLYYLISKEPHPYYTKFNFIRTLIANTLLYGNGYAIIERNKVSGRPISLRIVEPSFVNIHETTDGELYYMVAGKPGMQTKPYPPRDVIHIKTLSLNGITGLDLVRHQAENLGISIASQQYAASYFGNGAHLGGLITHPGKLTKEAQAKIRSGWFKKYGGADKVGETAVLDEDMKYTPIGNDPGKAMLIENRRFQVEEIARILGVPLHMLYNLEKGATFASVEVMDTGLVKYTLRPWAKNIEEEFNRKLFTSVEKRSGQIYVRFNLDSLLRGDTKSRAEYYSLAIQNRWMSPNEVRRLESMNPYEGGDRYENPNITTTPPKEANNE